MKKEINTNNEKSILLWNAENRLILIAGKHARCETELMLIFTFFSFTHIYE